MRLVPKYTVFIKQFIAYFRIAHHKLIQCDCFQDCCGEDKENSTFKVISENTQCSDTGLTCAKTIIVSLEVSSLFHKGFIYLFIVI